MAELDRSAFVRGAKCQIIQVHWRWDVRKLGKVVVLTHVDHELGACFAYNDEPVTYRLNRKGRKIIDHDPSCIQSVYSLDDLRPVPSGGLLA
jgi:hypothetical protein